MDSKKYCTILTTFEDERIGEKIITSLLEKGLAACIQQQNINSFYRWNGEVENAQEKLLLIKTKQSLYKAVEEEIKNIHNYEIPEIIMLPIAKGYRPYLEWIEDVTLS